MHQKGIIKVVPHKGIIEVVHRKWIIIGVKHVQLISAGLRLLESKMCNEFLWV